MSTGYHASAWGLSNPILLKHSLIILGLNSFFNSIFIFLYFDLNFCRTKWHLNNRKMFCSNLGSKCSIVVRTLLQNTFYSVKTFLYIFSRHSIVFISPCSHETSASHDITLQTIICVAEERSKIYVDNIWSLDKVAVLLGKLSWMESNSSTSHNPWSGVTILLSLTVFLNMVAETMPVTSSNPLLGNATQAVCGCEVLWSLNTNMLTVVRD